MTTTKVAHTAGPWDYFVGNANGRGLIRIEQKGTGVHIASMVRGPESEANAKFITDAMEVATETGMTPRQLVAALHEERSLRLGAEGAEESLASERAELLTCLQNCIEVLDSEEMKGAWSFLFSHGIRWNGPEIDMKAARAAIAKATGAA